MRTRLSPRGLASPVSISRATTTTASTTALARSRASSGVLATADTVRASTSASTVAEKRPAIALGGTSRPSFSTTCSATGVLETRKA